MSAFFPEDIRMRYPYPLARTCHEINDASAALDACLRLLKFPELLLRYLTWIAVARYLSFPESDETAALDREEVVRIGRGSLGDLERILNKLLGFLKAHPLDDAFDQQTFVGALTGKVSDAPDLARGCNELTSLAQKGGASQKKSVSPLMFFSAYIAYRNKKEHGLGTLSESEAERFQDFLGPALRQLLEKLGFLCRAQLQLVTKVHVERGKMCHHFRRFMGAMPSNSERTFQAPLAPEHYFQEERVYLCDPDTARPFLSLHPLVIVYKDKFYLWNKSEGFSRPVYDDCFAIEQLPPEPIEEFGIPRLAAVWRETAPRKPDAPETQTQKTEGVRRQIDYRALARAIAGSAGMGIDTETQEAIRTACDEALLLRSPGLGVEHLFVGMTKLDNGLTQRWLAGMKIHPKSVRDRIRVYLLSNRSEEDAVKDLGVKPRLEQILKLARQFARKRNAKKLIHSDLLAAVVQEGNSLPVAVLKSMGVTEEQFVQMPG